jgi:glucose/arabinose dehydrogenase
MRALLASLLSLAFLGCSSPPANDVADVADRAAGLRVTTAVGHLELPWDVQPLPEGRLLISERDRAKVLVWRRGVLRALRFPSASVWVSGETGLMGLEVDPDFAHNRRVYTCQGGFTSTGHDVRIIAWRLDASYTRLTLQKVLLRGLPTTSGRHGGCRLLILRNGALLVGTGDAADERNPQSLTSLGGKTLRLNRLTGAPWPTNRWIDAANVQQRYVHTYGHRNVQGLAQRADGTLWSVEHGPDRDDEVNKLVNGGNYGWNPGPGYDESRPMTDYSLPGQQIGARWSSGYPTLATSGAAWVRGRQWGDLNGTLAVACLKASRLLFIKFDARGNPRWARQPAAVQRFGRLRSVTNAPNGDLLVTTSNGEDDRVLRVHPTG